MRGWIVILGGMLALGAAWCAWSFHGADDGPATPAPGTDSIAAERSTTPVDEEFAAVLEPPDRETAPVEESSSSSVQEAQPTEEPDSSEGGRSAPTPEVERLREQGRKLRLALGELRMTDPPLGPVGSAQLAISDAVAILLDMSGQYEAGSASPLIPRPGEHCFKHDGRMYRPKHGEFPEFDEIATMVLPRTYAKIFPEIRARQERESAEHGKPGEAVVTADLKSRIEAICEEVLLLIP